MTRWPLILRSTHDRVVEELSADYEDALAKGRQTEAFLRERLTETETMARERQGALIRLRTTLAETEGLLAAERHAKGRPASANGEPYLAPHDPGGR